MTQDIKIKIVKYDLDTVNPESKKEYKRIKDLCIKQGFRCMDCISDKEAWITREYIQKLPLSFTVETEFLFNDQYNTKEGHRIHDWYQVYDPSYKTRKTGYYVTGNLEALKQAKENQLVCGFCGKRYNKETAKEKFCTACLGSPYLEIKDLPLLLLLPVTQANKSRHDIFNAGDYPELKALYDAERPKMEARLKAEKLIRLKAQGERRMEEAVEKGKELLYEATIYKTLNDAGIDTENLIHYSHSKEWCFGWRTSATTQEREDFLKAVNEIKGSENLLAEFLSKITFK